MRALIGMIVGAAIVMAGSAQAQSSVPDLVGARAAGGEQELQSRGWVHIKTDKGDDRVWSYWWQPSQRKCITVAVVDGHFNAVTDTLPIDCNQREKSGSSGAAVVAGVGIAAIIAAAALAHNQHSHDNGKHYDDDASEAGYERGYRDGLYNRSYHNYDRSDPYARGYEAGVVQRGRETDYRAPHRDTAAGYAHSVELNDLVDARGSSADGEMGRRGFRNVGGLKSGMTSYTYWFNARTRQCVQMGVADGRVANITDVGRYPGCH